MTPAISSGLTLLCELGVRLTGGRCGQCAGDLFFSAEECTRAPKVWLEIGCTECGAVTQTVCGPNLRSVMGLGVYFSEIATYHPLILTGGRKGKAAVLVRGEPSST